MMEGQRPFLNQFQKSDEFRPDHKMAFEKREFAEDDSQSSCLIAAKIRNDFLKKEMPCMIQHTVI
jgi:hypothetical protein